jgi:hypothetical protein
LDQVERLLAVDGLADHLHVGFAFQDHPDPAAD